MIKELTLIRYAKYRSRLSKIDFICPLCNRPLRAWNGMNHVTKHVDDFHYEMSDLWFKESETEIYINEKSELEKVILKIWQLEYEIRMIEFIGRVLDNHNVLGLVYYNADLETKHYRIKKLREISMQLTS